MAKFSVNTHRFDPYRNFKFRVKVDNQYVAGLSKCSALKRTTEVTQWREAGDPSTSRQLPGKTKYEPVTLEAGLTHDLTFEAWANLVHNFQGDAAVSLQELPQGHHHRRLQRGRAEGPFLQAVPLLGLGVPGAARARRERQRRRHPAHQARERGLGARSVGDGARGDVMSARASVALPGGLLDDAGVLPPHGRPAPAAWTR